MTATTARFAIVLLASDVSVPAQPKAGESPTDHLPPHITQLTRFGERGRMRWIGAGLEVVLFISALV